MIKKFFTRNPIKYKYNLAICCIVKDESHYLQEWISYHLRIGVEHFYIYDNESKIPLAVDLDQFIKKGFVSVEVVKGKMMQLHVYQKCLQQKSNDSKWIAVIDADEFIVPKTPTGNLSELLKAYEKYGGLAINWLVFGSNGHSTKQTSQIHSYTKRSLKSHIQNRHIKTIVQTRFIEHLLPLDPHHFHYKKGQFCVTENFERIDLPLTETHSSGKIQINHYNLRSLEEFKEKLSRGTADGTPERDLQYFYNVDNASNIITDESILELIMLMDGK